MATPLNVLIVEDRPADAALMVHELRRAGFDPVWRRVETEEDYLAHLQAGLDVILADYTLPQFDALHHEMAERQRLEQEAQRAQHFAVLGRLAAGVSHEIRNPLGAIFLHFDLLQEVLREPSSESPGDIAETLAEIQTNLKRLDDLVQDYLSPVRVTQIERTPGEMGAAVQAWAREWQEHAAARAVTLRLESLERLGSVAFHESTLRRALLNLVQNALDAMPEGGTLIVAGRSTATHVQLQVRDTGSGIPAPQLAQIFEPLYTTKPGGTGLGLYIVQQIVAAHGGQVTVESVAGQGTTFILTLPQTPEAPPAATPLVALKTPTSL